MTLKKILSTFNECVFQNTAKIVNNTHKWLMLNNEKKKKIVQLYLEHFLHNNKNNLIVVYCINFKAFQRTLIFFRHCTLIFFYSQ